MEDDEPNIFGVEARQGVQKKKRKMHNKAAEQEVVELQLPHVEHTGEEAAALTMKVKAPVSKRMNDGLWVELTVENCITSGWQCYRLMVRSRALVRSNLARARHHANGSPGGLRTVT